MAETAVDKQDEEVAGPRAVWRIVRRRDFGPYFLGNALSASGTWFQNLAAALLIYRLTHSALLLGVLNFSQFIPILVLTPWAGSLADRLDRRKLLFVSQSLAVVLAAGLAALAWGGLASTWVVIGDTLCLGVVSAFSAPAQQALIVSLVRRDEVPTAVALNSMTFNLARVLGPAGLPVGALPRNPGVVRRQRGLLRHLHRSAGRRPAAPAGEGEPRGVARARQLSPSSGEA